MLRQVDPIFSMPCNNFVFLILKMNFKRIKNFIFTCKKIICLNEKENVCRFYSIQAFDVDTGQTKIMMHIFPVG